MRNPIILFSGVHGVGKGYFLRRVYRDIDKYTYYSASGLISLYKDATDAGYKRVQDVGANQRTLLNAIDYIEEGEERNILLDGHLCIINANNEIETIHKDFFIDANICGIILLRDSSEMVLNRLRERDVVAIPIDVIEKIQDMELEYAKKIKEEMGIDFFCINHNCSREEFLYNLSVMWRESI